MSEKTIYRNAAALAAIQLDRPFSARDLARIDACLWQARIMEDPKYSGSYNTLAEILKVAGQMSDDVHDRLAPMATLEEALEDTTKRIAAAFAPRLPKAEDSNG